jgi:predicted ester cyclase
MSSDDLQAHDRRLADELLTQGDLAVAHELFTPDCRHDAPEPVAPGALGIASCVAELRHAFPDLRAIVEDELAEGTMVALRLSLGGTQKGQFQDIAPSGHHATWQLITILHANPHGRFVEVWSSWDRLGLLTHLDNRSSATNEARAPPVNPTGVLAITDLVLQDIMKEIR